MSGLTAMEACALLRHPTLWFQAGIAGLVRSLTLPLAFGFLVLLLSFAISLGFRNHHNSFPLINALLHSSQHAYQSLINFIHVVVHDELIVTTRQRLQDEVCSQLLTQRKIQPFKVLNIPNHFEYMSSNRASFCQFATK